MTHAGVVDVLQNAVTTVLLSSAPMLLAAMIIGLIVSIFQATTQINEQTLAFVPKVVGVLLALIFFGSFIMNNVETFTKSLYDGILTAIG